MRLNDGSCKFLVGKYIMLVLLFFLEEFFIMGGNFINSFFLDWMEEDVMVRES